MQNRSGCEKTVVEDPETGREVWRMTDYPAHDLHTYCDACSCSPDGSKVIDHSDHTGTSQIYLIPLKSSS